MVQIPETFSPHQGLLKDKIILVTGATGGFGKAISLACAGHGASVILLARNIRLTEALYDEIENAGYPKPAIYPMNLEGATEHDYQELAQNIDQEFGRLDGLIHCAAMLGTPTPFEHSDTEIWYQVHQVNLHAAYLLTRSVISLLKQSKQASLVFITDDKKTAYWDAYTVSKQGVVAMAELLAAEYEGSSLHVNWVNPGKTRTALQLSAFPAADNNLLPVPADHVKLFLYLMSNELNENGDSFTP
ncbi:MAG: SDR family NAD(P)-dependent oxidoreductase [Gammaproteobacteria bacterium]|jgi:NAD(P)-dependent dehydrogenase (short-subunit alcohol dehydrogenase family)|nr:SDR family NAD(P)-dependent oxidoreductase [Gammaproteobacteria bacterium]